MMWLGDYETVYRANPALERWEYLHLVEASSSEDVDFMMTLRNVTLAGELTDEDTV